MHASDFIEDLTRYRDWAPTAFDCRGLGEVDVSEWFVAPVMITRDTGPGALERSNWERLCEIAEAEGIEHTTRTMGHWGPGWFEILLIAPAHAEWLAGWVCALADYPIVDESHFSGLERGAMADYWERESLQERIRICADCGVSIFAARRDYMPNDGRVDEYLRECVS